MASKSTDDGGTDRAQLSYWLSCADCSFETTVEGDTADVFAVIDDHEENYDHFVEARAEW